MREIVGVFLHKEAFEQLSGIATGSDDEALREQIVDKANEAKALQKQITREANRYAIDQLFEVDRDKPRDERPWRTGTVMGLTPTKVHVLLDEPRIDIKVYVPHLSQITGSNAQVSKDETVLELPGLSTSCRLGDPVRVRVHDRDAERDRWVLALEPIESSSRPEDEPSDH
jgi:exoribonuclease R